MAAVFGSFLKYVVSKTDDQPSASLETSQPNAFTVLLSSQARLSQPGIPKPLTVRTAKDKLYNSILSYLEEQDLSWKSDEIESQGKTFVRKLTNVLWTIDGHHHIFMKQCCAIPDSFQCFQGFNLPEKHKHRKRSISNLDGDVIKRHSSALFEVLHAPFWDRSKWVELKRQVELLGKSLHTYCEYLKRQSSRQKTVHESTEPIRSFADGVSLTVIEKNDISHPQLNSVERALEGMNTYNHLSLENFLPDGSKERYEYIQRVKRGLKYPCVLFTYSTGNNRGNFHFIWKCPDSGILNASDILNESQPIIEEVKKEVPKYFTRAMKKAIQEKFGRLSPKVKPMEFRFIFKELTGDCSASTNLSESEVDQRVKEFVDMEDLEIIPDLRTHNKGRKKSFEEFWAACEQVLNDQIGLAADERRHDTVSHVASAVSVRDLWERARSLCSEGTPIPSQEWLRLQFWPKNKHARVSLQYTGRLKVKYMVQRRQFRKDHCDSHYAACIFKYMREYAIFVRDYCLFVCLDDKHRLKVGEPGYPVASAERGRRVIVKQGTLFEVGDHDFTKYSLIPSVAFFIDIPSDVTGSWYDGQVHVLLKDAAFEPSSAVRHATELASIITSKYSPTPPILFLYTDGGPDHNLSHVGVQLSIIALFLYLDLDFICASRTCPYQSWRNPVERIMSILNIGLQCIGLMRELMSQENEKLSSRCNSLSDLRRVSKEYPDFVSAVADSLAPVKIMLTDIFLRLELKSKKFSVFSSATPGEIDSFWIAMLTIDAVLSDPMGKYRKATVAKSSSLRKFLSHCCQVRHYTFSVLKCGKPTCTICRPPRLPSDVFDQLHHLPDPSMGEGGHYKPFMDVFGRTTTEDERPSKKKSRDVRKGPFIPSVQHAKNTNVMVQCEECLKWRLVYSRYKLKPAEKAELEAKFEDFSFSCGCDLYDIGIDDVFVRDLTCSDHMEKLYYSLGHEIICVYCSEEVEDTNQDGSIYPQCTGCKDLPPIHKYGK